MIRLMRLVTYGLFAACAWILVFDENAVSLFLDLFFLAMCGVLVLVVRRRVRQQRRKALCS